MMQPVQPWGLWRWMAFWWVVLPLTIFLVASCPHPAHAQVVGQGAPADDADAWPVRLAFAPSAVDANNSTTTPLAGKGVFTGTATDLLNFAGVSLNVATDVDSAADGLSIQWSSDGTNWDIPGSGGEKYTIVGLDGRSMLLAKRARYYRVVYTNGNSDQTYFRLQALLNPIASQPRVFPINGDLRIDEAALLTRSVIVGESTAKGGVMVNVKVNPSGSVQVAGDVTANQGTAASLSGRWPVAVTDGTNTMPAMDAAVRRGFVALSNGGTELGTGGTGTGLTVTCTNCGGASPFADNSAFTFGTTGITNVGAVVDDTATNTVVEDNAGAPRMSGSRVLYGNLRDASGNEVATATAAPGSGDRGLVVRNLPSGIQTVSGNVTADQGRPAPQVDRWPMFLSDGTAERIGQQLMAASLPVVIASNQSAVPVTANQGTAAAQSNRWPTFLSDGTAERIGQQTMAASVPVVIASNQTAVPVSGTVTANQGGAPWSQNVTQFAGNAVQTGVGAAGVGVPRVTESLDPVTYNAPFACSVGTGSTLCLAANASRKGAAFKNTSNFIISCAIAATAVLNSGITLEPGDAWNMGRSNLATGAINCIAGAAASNLSGQEYQ